MYHFPQGATHIVSNPECESALDKHISGERKHLSLVEEIPVLEERLEQMKEKVTAMPTLAKLPDQYVREVKDAVEDEILCWRRFNASLISRGKDLCDLKNKRKVKFDFSYEEFMGDYTASSIKDACNHTFFRFSEEETPEIFYKRVSWYFNINYTPRTEGTCYYDISKPTELITGVNTKDETIQRLKQSSFKERIVIGLCSSVLPLVLPVLIYSSRYHFKDKHLELNPFVTYANHLEKRLAELDEMVNL